MAERKSRTNSHTPVPTKAGDPVVGEAKALAVGISESYRDYVNHLITSWGKSVEDAAAEGREAVPAWRLEQIHAGDGEHTSWSDLRHLEDTDPGAGAAKWQAMKQEARDELASGLRGAKAIEWGGELGPWDRARYLALWESFRAEWRPRGGIEENLVAQLAMACTAFETWTNRAIGRSTWEAGRDRNDYKRKGKWVPERVDEFQAAQQAAEMATRWNGVFLRTLRALRDLRRYGGSLSITADTVNIGQTQHISPAPQEPEPALRPAGVTLVQEEPDSED